MLLWAHKREKFVHGSKYTPLYEKGIKESQNKPMETTLLLPLPTRKKHIGSQKTFSSKSEKKEIKKLKNGKLEIDKI